jgi:putative chitinase
MNLDQLVAIMEAPTLRCKLYLPLLQEGMGKYHIRTEKQRACFLATIGHESAALRLTREGWGPTPAQLGYEGRKDLGNTEPGDGSRFRGRGLIQITGRANYAEASKALGHDYLDDPEQLEQPRDAAISACWWWDAHGCNKLAESGGMRAVTRRVNGGLNGYPERLAYYGRAYRELFGKPPDFSNVIADSKTTAPQGE